VFFSKFEKVNLGLFIYKASKNGDINTVELLLSYGSQIDEKNRDGQTPLMHAIGCELTNKFKLKKFLSF
jgi:ankyrin repeat protein